MTQKTIIILSSLAFFSMAALVLGLINGYYEARTITSSLPKPEIREPIKDMAGASKHDVLCNEFSISTNNDGRIILKDLSGDTIIRNIWYYACHTNQKEKWGLDNVITEVCNDSTLRISGEGLERTKVEVILTASGPLHKLDIEVNTSYQRQVEVIREALLFELNLPVSEVYKKNRKRDTRNFSDEYWLQRQGVFFSDDENSVFVYNTQGISSMQLDTKNRILCVNLEFSEDHPHINIPYQTDRKGDWVDQSTALYLPDTHRKDSLSFVINLRKPVIPRVMLVPNGNLAGYVFTEHADGGTLASHRAVYFGSDTISLAANATGGFVGNKIPVTKSIFYCNPEKQSYSSIKDDNDGQSYFDFLNQLYKTGLYEICLHTPEGGMSDRKVMEEALYFMKDHFQSGSWIDHGMEYGDSNRECFFADGLHEDSKHFSADLWGKYDIRYFWSIAVEKIGESKYISITDNIKNLKIKVATKAFWRKYFSPEEMKSLNFINAICELFGRFDDVDQINSLQPRLGERAPTPLYWQHKTRTGPFYSWVTDYSDDYSEFWRNDANKEYLNKLLQIDQLVEQNGVYIDHGYYIRNMKNTDLTYNKDGAVLLNPYFEKFLIYIAERRDSGDLYIATLRDLVDYWVLSENVVFDYLPNGEVIVSNNNYKPIMGLSLAVSAAFVTVDHEVPHMRQIGDDMVFWFDLGARESVALSFSSEHE